LAAISSAAQSSEAEAMIDLSALPIFPCNLAKEPLTAHGFKDARRGANTRGWPLVGFPTGAVSGIDVLDLDPTGDDWYGQKLWALPQTRAHQTQRGLHLLFRHAPGLRCSTSRIAPGVDVKADGGYAIFWPRQGLAVKDLPLAEWPEWLLEEARSARGYLNNSLSPPASVAVADIREALFALDPIGWRNDEHNAEGYLRWLALMTACKAAGIGVEDWVRWSVQDPVYAGHGDLIARLWRGARAKHSGALWVALKEAGVRIRGQGRKEIIEVPHRHPQVDWRIRFTGIIEWLRHHKTERDLFSASCLVAEIIAQHRKPKQASQWTSLRRPQSGTAFGKSWARMKFAEQSPMACITSNKRYWQERSRNEA
jgi:hypothetical protein